ncbi:hypothetical protein HDV00_002157 [Rhizophlyctis rosea]|nr:hypothetical protein HDV00_002157 [Rhizophlyctis rosea]
MKFVYTDDLDTKPYAIFIFKYGSRELLQAQNIIPSMALMNTDPTDTDPMDTESAFKGKRAFKGMKRDEQAKSRPSLLTPYTRPVAKGFISKPPSPTKGGHQHASLTLQNLKALQRQLGKAQWSPSQNRTRPSGLFEKMKSAHSSSPPKRATPSGLFDGMGPPSRNPFDAGVDDDERVKVGKVRFKDGKDEDGQERFVKSEMG